ncbi:MAG: hypothetical protein LBS86_06900 [Treponema sp.]|jgi:hypothetical protein|nr:hypothetical protein [Treponema sp.]
MSEQSVTFGLPLGLVWQGKTYRQGHLHLATTGDELELQSADAVAMNPRYRDIFLLARVIDDFEGLAPVTPAMIEELFEADFLYLQLLYQELNSEAQTRITSVCPACAHSFPLDLPRLYNDMSMYHNEKNEKSGD